MLLCEQDDLASHTSSASTKLIHGGLRYLEEFHFALVRKALREREVLLAAAPHIMRPLHFVMPYAAHLRPAWLIRAGLFLYDHLAQRAHLAASAAVDLDTHITGQPLKAGYHRGFVYSDGWVDDARLVVLNALDAQARGARILTRVRCEKLQPQGRLWSALLRAADGTATVTARAVVNATGPWVSDFVTRATPVRAAHQVRLVKGSHIVVPRLFDHRYAYIFQNEDRRIVFAIPYEHAFTLIGTTDVDYHADPAAVHIEAAEISYLCALANSYFKQPISPAEVVWSYSGVRPLLQDESNDPMSVTRDYALELDREPAPLLSIFGGKITTYRKLAEDAVNLLAGTLDTHAPPWTAGAMLPGGICLRGVLRCSCVRSNDSTRGCPRPCAAATRTPTAHAWDGCSVAPPHSANSVPRCCRSSTSANLSICAAKSSRARRRTSSGAVPNSACICCRWTPRRSSAGCSATPRVGQRAACRPWGLSESGRSGRRHAASAHRADRGRTRTAVAGGNLWPRPVDSG